MQAGRLLFSAVTIAILLASPVALRGAQNTRPTAQAILAQAAAYVAEFMTRFTVVIGEETYGAKPRQVKSDVLFLRSPGDTGWLYYRDTYESREGVVRPHEDRLTRLFESPETVGRELANIERSQVRYQNGTGRTLAHPLLALSFLQAGLQSRFAFTLRNLDKGVGPNVWIVEYKETQRPTILQADGDRPVSGRFWVESNTGRVM